MVPGWGRLVVAAAGLAATCLGGALAGAAPLGDAAWRQTVTLAPQRPGILLGSPKVALSNRGTAIAAWSASPEGFVLAERARPGRWTMRPLASYPWVLVVDARGDALLSWIAGEADARRVVVSQRRAGGKWRRRTLVPRVTSNSVGVDGGLDAEGRATVTWWSWRPETGDYLVERSEQAPSGAWTTPSIVGVANGSVDLATAASGDAAIVWSQPCGDQAIGCPPSGSLVRVVTRAAGRGWSRPRTLSDPRVDSRTPTVAANAGGTLLVVWQTFSFVPGQPPRRTIQGIAGTTRRSFGRAQTLFEDNALDSLRVEVAPTGEGLALWSWSDGSEEYVFTARRRPQGGFGPAIRLGRGFEPALGIDDHGVATAVWTRPSGPSYPPTSDLVVHVARRPAGGSFVVDTDLATVGRDCTRHRGCDTDVALAVNEQGDALAIWRAHVGAGTPGETYIQAARFDARR